MASALRQPLDAVLGTRGAVRVLRVLSAHGGALSAPLLARRTRLTRAGTWKALVQLQTTGIVEAVGQGRSVSYRVDRRHRLAEAIRALFTAESARATGALDRIRKAAANLEPAPIALWLVGSVARDEEAPGSDMDLVLVADGRRVRGHADRLRDAVAAAPETWGLEISVLSLSPRELRNMVRERPALWRSLERDAVTLLGAPPEALAR